MPVRTGLTADIGGRCLNTNGEGGFRKNWMRAVEASHLNRGMKFGTERSEKFVELKCK